MRKIKLFILIMVILCIKFTIITKGESYYDINLPKSIQEFLYNKSQHYNIEYELALSIIALETEETFDMNFKSNNINNIAKIISVDRGLFQINSNYEKWYAELAKINNDDYDAYEPCCNIVMGLAGLQYWREQVIKELKLNNEEEILIATLECYNKGLEGYKRYIKDNNTKQSAYSKVVLKYYNKIKEGVYVKKRGKIQRLTN